ncbi:hypothetical protein BJX61DRAFT_540129 [Aspergillus egyptiacus]|nr:hypothetical protein BJX61DRAFT_540129 [Aspergillus egyptiacus]
MSSTCFSLPQPTYVLDPDGDVIFVLRGVPRSLALLFHCKDIYPTLLSSMIEVLQCHTTFDDAENPPETDSHTLRIRGSSKHFALASAPFREVLRSNPSTEYHMDSHTITFMLLLMMVHGQTRIVPRTASLTTLTSLAYLVEVFQCGEAVSIYSDLWIEALRPAVPDHLNNDAMSWLYVAWVFNKPDIFQQMSKLLITESTSPVNAGGLPVPREIIRRINMERIGHVETLIEGLYGLLFEIQHGCLLNDNTHDLYDPAIQNRSLCTSTVMGSYTLQLMRLGIVPIEPATPFPRLSVSDILRICREDMHSPLVSELGAERAHQRCCLASRVGVFIQGYRSPDGVAIDDEEFGGLRRM